MHLRFSIQLRKFAKVIFYADPLLNPHILKAHENASAFGKNASHLLRASSTSLCISYGGLDNSVQSSGPLRRLGIPFRYLMYATLRSAAASPGWRTFRAAKSDEGSRQVAGIRTVLRVDHDVDTSQVLHALEDLPLPETWMNTCGVDMVVQVFDELVIGNGDPD